MSTTDLEASMRKSVEATQRNFNTIRTGRANSSLLDRINVEYYGAETPLKSLATLSTPDSQTIQIQPFDISALASIEKAIAMSELGFTPNNDGKIIRINVPPLTEERRKDMVKILRAEAEDARVAVRNVRRDANADFKELLKDKEITEDEQHGGEARIQKLTDEHVARIDQALTDKEQEIMTV